MQSSESSDDRRSGVSNLETLEVATARATKTEQIAVLGGGIAAIVAAFRLTDPALGGKYRVTIYQQGWRLGGKCASGRNAAYGQRIQEHGLHVWFGFYDNAFQAIGQCFTELNRGAEVPIRDIETAFLPCSEVVLCQEQDGIQIPFEFYPAPNELKPGDPQDPPGLWQILATALGWLLDWFTELTSSGEAGSVGEFGSFVVDLVGTAFAFGEGMISQLTGRKYLGPSNLESLQALTIQLTAAKALAVTAAEQPTTAISSFGPILESLAIFENSLRSIIYGNGVGAEFKLFFTTFNAFLSAVRGIVADDLLTVGFNAINAQELRAWLAKHGADPITLNGALIMALYDQAFAFRNGVATLDNREVAAGTVISHVFKMLFQYKGAFIYKMMAGMGDTIFAPFYELLKKRHVTFKFFSCIEKLHCSSNKEIESIDLISQVALAPGHTCYNPLISVKNLPCWPDEPDWTQLEDAAKGCNFELECNPLCKGVTTLTRGNDFDRIVLGISVAALPAICGELAAIDACFKAMLDNAHTVRTQSFQTWLNKPLKDRPGARGLGYAGQDETTLTGFVEPLDTYADMSHLIAAENSAPVLNVKSVGYFCGVLDDRQETYGQASARVAANAIDYFNRNALQLWPGAVTQGGDFDWNVMVDGSNAVGPNRFNAQFWVANYYPTDRYVQTWSNSIQFRLAPYDSGFANLTLAGDWTRTGLDLGCVEAAVISGNVAAQAIIAGDTADLTLQLDNYYRWLKPSNLPTAQRARPAYVDYGGLTSSSQPDLCLGTTLYGFIVKANYECLKAICHQVFNQPSSGAVTCDPLGNWLVLTFGKIDKIRPQTPPFSGMGYATEQNVTIWVPVTVLHRERGIVRSLPLAWFVPYIWVDNPLSLVNGREIYGYAKQWGWITLPDVGSRGFALDAFGGNFGLNIPVDRRPLLRLYDDMNVGRAREQGPFEQAAASLRRMLADVASFKVIEDFEKLLFKFVHVSVPQIFLKEFRSIANGREATLMQITQAAARVKQVRRIGLLNPHSLVVYPLDSHPLGRQLGLTDQRLSIGFEIDVDFELSNGVVLWDSSARTPY